VCQDCEEWSEKALMEEDFHLHQRVGTNRGNSVRPIILTALVAFMLGIGLAALLVWHGDLDQLARRGRGAVQTPQLAPAALSQQQVGGLETRLALLEDRFSRLNQDATAAAGNASRAEALLIAEVARRSIDRGEPLGTTADALRLRFGDAQPRAVEALIAFSAKPVTLEQLYSQLDALAPEIANIPADVSTWSRVQIELSNLFTVHSGPSSAVPPAARIERAKLLLGTGQVAQAIDEVMRLPNAPSAASWVGDARRYAEAQQALDLIETTAMLDQHLLREDSGRAAEQPSPPQQPAPSQAP
jgi:hypothetical protein